MQLVPLLVALAASLVLCILPRWLVILLIILFLLLSAIFLGVSTAWLMFHPNYEQSEAKLIEELKIIAANDWSKQNCSATMPDDVYSNRLLVSKNVDPIIKDIITRILDDHLFAHVKRVTKNTDEQMKPIRARLTNETWVIVSRILARLRVVDEVKLLTKDLVERLNKHFNKINTSTLRRSAYIIPAHMTSDETEKDYLRRFADVLLHAFIPQSYMAFTALRHLLREIVAVQVLFRTICLFSDPNYLNRQILIYIATKKLEQQSRPNNKVTARYIYAENFDQFVSVIKDTHDLDQLHQMRYIILNEIMQATCILNLKKEQRNLEAASRSKVVSWSSVKREDLLNRNLPTYINQLRVSLQLCEKKIASFTQESDSNPAEDTPISTVKLTQQRSYLPRKKIYPLSLILADPISHEIFYKFLKDTLSSSNNSNLADSTAYHLVQFWDLVSQMRNSDSVKSISIAHDILTHSYFLSSIQSQIKMPKDIIKKMESFIVGEHSAEPFYQTQKVVLKILEEKYYPVFCSDKSYDRLLSNPKFPSIKFDTPDRVKRSSTGSSQTNSIEYSVISGSSGESATSIRPPDILERHLLRAQEYLANLQSFHRNKCDAFTALRQNMDFESPSIDSYGKLAKKLEREISQLESDIATAEVHLARTCVWVKHLTAWRAELYSIQAAEDDAAVLAIIVQPDETNPDLGCDAWVIARSVNELINLKKKLVKIKPSLSKIVIFRLRSLREVNDSLLKKAKDSINCLFSEIFNDEDCLKSEDVFLFFISSPPNLRQPLARKTSKSIPFANLFGINLQKNCDNSKSVNIEKQDIDDMSNFLDEIDGEDSLKDDIAEPAYALLTTVFDLEGNTSWLRKSMISLVQITYRKTINKQIRETVNWLLSESMVSMYLSRFRDALWPPSASASDNSSVPNYEDVEGDKLYTITKVQMVQNLPDLLINFFGEATAKQGAVKVLEAMQQQALNKALLHEVLEVFLLSLVPELNNHSPATPGWEG